MAPPLGELSPKVTERALRPAEKTAASRFTHAAKVRRTFNRMSPFPGEGG